MDGSRLWTELLVGRRRLSRGVLCGANPTSVPSASYSYKSLTVGNVEYPFPSGLYLSRIIQLIQRWPREDPLVRMLTNVQSFGGKYSKEISEVMAMIDAVERGVKMTCGGRPCCSLEGM